MKTGKISESVLKRSVIKYIGKRDKEMIKGAGVGEDCAFLQCKGTKLAVSTQTVILPVEQTAKYAVYAAANNLATKGIKTQWITMALTLPTSMEEKTLQDVMKQADKVCEDLGIQIVGGHTEVSDKVNVPIVSVTAMGTELLCANDECEQVAEAMKEKTNLDIVMTKWIGLEGTAMVAREKEEELLTRYPNLLIKTAQSFDRYLSLIPEAATAGRSGVYTMHDIRNGGVFGALYELAKRMGVGLSIDLKKIPVKQETIEVCEFFDLNPYELLSGGSLLVVTKDGESLVEKLAEENINAAVIGKTTPGNDKVVVNDDETRFLEPAKADEIFKIDFMTT